MPYNNNKFIICLSIILACIFSDKNIFASETKSEFFNIKIHENIDNLQLLEKLDIKYFLHLTVIPSGSRLNIEGTLKKTLDALYLEVSDILDIHMYSFEIQLEILPNKEYLSEILRQYGAKNVNTESYYFYEKNTVYISFEDLTVGILAHEVAHAIVSHYFVVTPPEKIQEILCGYAEYSIRKALNK